DGFRSPSLWQRRSRGRRWRGGVAVSRRCRGAERNSPPLARGWGRAGHHGCFHHRSPPPLEYPRDSRSWGGVLAASHFTSPASSSPRRGAGRIENTIPYPRTRPLSVWCGRCAATRAAAGEKLTGSERSRVVPPTPAERRNASSISTALLKAVRGDEIEQ